MTEVYVSSPLYFVTLCTAERSPWLACDEVHERFVRYAQQGHDSRGIAIGRFVLMPDHLHLFVRFPAEESLPQWARQLKRTLSNGEPMKRWQSGFFDHVLRHGESYSEKWEYVRNNPVRAGLCAQSHEWPYQGEIVSIEF